MGQNGKQREGENRIEVQPFRSWHIAIYGGIKATGASRAEAIAQLLHSLRSEVEVVEIRVEPIRERGRAGKRAGG